VGVVNTLTSYGIYSVLFYLGVNPLICNIPAFVISVFVSFLLNNRFVFRENEEKEKRKWYYVLVFVMPLSSMGITLTAEKIAGYLVPILNLVISIPINFLLNKFWAYRQKNKEEDAYEFKD
jgi:putative flippase GtrA